MPQNQRAHKSSSNHQKPTYHTSGQTSKPSKAHRPSNQPNTQHDIDPNTFKPPHDPSEPPDYDYSKDRGRRIRMRPEEQCVFNHSTATNNPLLDLKQWRDKLKVLRALPKPQQKSNKSGNTSDSPVKRPKHKPQNKHKLAAKLSARDRKTRNKANSKLLPSDEIPDEGENEDDDPLVLGEEPEIYDTDLVTFHDILDPQITADTRYDRYLDELQKVHDIDKDDLASLYQQQFVEGRKRSNKNDGVLRHDFEGGGGEESTSNEPDTIQTEMKNSSSDDEIDVSMLVSRQPMRKNVRVGGGGPMGASRRAISTDPAIQVSGNYTTLHDKSTPNESRLSLNNFKLRLNLAENDPNQLVDEFGRNESNDNSPRKSVLDSDREVHRNVKLVGYVTKNSTFSPRRTNSMQHMTSPHVMMTSSGGMTSSPEVRKEQHDLRRDALHLPSSTTYNNQRPRRTLAATKTVNTEVKGGGWKVQVGSGGGAKREIDFDKMIPVSVTASLKNKMVGVNFGDLWNVA